jgi:DNA-binding GntR family transcriptional regulator
LARTGNKDKIRTDHTRMAHKGIRRLLFENKIVPGQKLSYRMIAESLGMSLTPVVQALKILEFQGLVRHIPNRGYFAEPLSLQEIKEIYDLREVVEISLLPKVIENLDSESIRKLRGFLEKDLGSDMDLNARLIMDRDFHTLLAAVSGQKVQMHILENLFDLLYLKYRGSLIFVASEVIVGSQHRMIFDALVTRDIHQATDAMTQHFKTIRNRALATLSQILAGKDVCPL